MAQRLLATQAERLTILIVEDDPAFRSLVRSCLEGHDKVTAETADAGLERFKKQHPDITFLDIRLPDGNGLDVLREMRAFDPHAFIVMVTSSILKKDAQEALARGAAGYITKPFNRQKLQKQLDLYQRYRDKHGLPTSAQRARTYHTKLQQEAGSRPASGKGPIIPDVPDIIHSWSVLYADPVYSRAETTKNDLKRLGIRHIDTVENGQAAWDMLRSHDYHLLFVQPQLPEIDGLLLTQLLRRRESGRGSSPAVIIGMLDEQAAEATPRKCLASGMDHTVTLPLHYPQLDELTQSFASRQRDMYIQQSMLAANSDHNGHVSGMVSGLAQKEVKRWQDEYDMLRHCLSHALRDPLRKARQDGDEMLRRGTFDKAALEALLGQLDHMLQRVDLLQEYTGYLKRKPAFADVECQALMSEVRSSMHDEIERCKAVIHADDLPTVSGNGDMLVRLFRELIDNALRYSGQIKPEIHLTAASQPDQWLFSFQNKGVQIDPMYASLLFRPFQRLAPEDGHERHGMGLALCRQIVEHHGGALWLDHHYDKGTRFCFTLPLAMDGG